MRLATQTYLFVCLLMLRFQGPVNPMGSCCVLSVYLTTLLLGRLSPLSGWPVLCTFFHQKLTTALLEPAEEGEWPWKYFMIKSPHKNVADLAGVKPATSWSSVGGCGFDPTGSATFFRGVLITKYFLLSFSHFHWFKKGSCQFLMKECAQTHLANNAQSVPEWSNRNWTH